MSEIKVSQMPEANNINDNDLLMIIQGGYNKKIPKELLGIPTKAHQVNVGEDTEYRVNLLYSKNLLNLQNGTDTDSETSVVRVINNGTITINGTPVNTNYNRVIGTFKAIKSGTYTLTPNKSATNSDIRLIYQINNGSWVSDDVTPLITLSAGDILSINLRISSTNSISNFVLKPMLNEGNTALDFEPFIPNQINVDNEKYSDTINVGATEDNRSRVNVLHSNNLIKPTLTTTTQNGVTCTNNGDGTYTLNGTATDTCQFNILTNLNLNGSYKMTGCPSTGSQDTYYMFARNSAWSKFIGDTGEGIIGVFDSTVTVMCIAVTNGTTCDNVVFKPMITKDTSKTYADFEPYVIPSIKVDNEEIYSKGTEWTTDISGVFSYRKINGVVYIRFNDKQITTTSGTWLALGTLPSGIDIRPSQYIVLDGANNGIDGKYTTAITTTGSVRVRTTTPGTDVINGLIFYIP